MYTVVWFYMLPYYIFLRAGAVLEGEFTKMHDIKIEQVGVREVDIQRLLRLLWKRLWVIILATVIGGMLTAMYTVVFINPTYRTSFKAYINNKQITEETVSTSTSDLSASKGLMHVYREIVMSRSVITEAAKISGLYDRGYKLYSNMVKAYVSDDAPILTVYVETEDPELSQKFAEAIAEIAPQQVSQVVAGSTMKLIDVPTTPKSPYSPNVFSNTVYGALISMVLAVIALIAIDMIYDKVLEEDDFEGRYHLPVVGRIPDLQLAQRNDTRYGNGKERGGRR